MKSKIKKIVNLQQVNEIWRGTKQLEDRLRPCEYALPLFF